MILGMSTSTFTLVHVVLSLVGIFAGVIVLFGMLSAKRLDGWIGLFLATTVLTSVTGFLFPSDRLLPSHIVGILSLVALALAILALYVYHLAGSWRWIYVTSALVALYLNVPEAAVLDPAGTDAVRAAIPGHAAGGDGALHRRWLRGS